MNNVTPIPVRLEAFEGPLDLLLHLIDKNKINIYDIPVSEITDQYLDYVQQMKEEKLEVTSEFLVMAATLLDLKSRMLLPREEEEEEEQGDPREELVQRLLDYKLTKYQSEELKDKSLEASKNVFRAQDLPREVKEYQPPLDYDELLGETTLKSLTKIFEDVLKRQKNRVDPVRSTFGRIKKEEVSIEARTEELMAYFRTHSSSSFRALLEGQRTRQSLIVTFLILLDFIKSGLVHIRQSHIFGEIEIFTGALPVGGMGPQETLPSNKAEARAMRKAQKQKEKEAAEAAPVRETEEKEPAASEAGSIPPREERLALETVSSYKPRVILSVPENSAREEGQEEEKEEELIIEETPIEEPEQEETGTAPEPADTAADPSPEEEEDAATDSEEEGVHPENMLSPDPKEESPGISPEDTWREENGSGHDTESGDPSESAVYRLIRSKDWETLLDEYMEDEGLAELLEEEKEETSCGIDSQEAEPEEADLSAEAVSDPEPEKKLDTEASKEQDTAEKESDREAADSQPVPEPSEKPEGRIDELPEETSEEEWKKAKYLQPSRLYCSPWAGRWKCPKSPRPSKSRNRMPGKPWKRSGRSLIMRAAAFRSIATTMPYSSLPERNIMST